MKIIYLINIYGKKNICMHALKIMRITIHVKIILLDIIDYVT